MSVDILMATYNGEKYLRNQILSLQQQTYTDWTLWVRDDGSNDGTISILSDFATNDQRVRIVDQGEEKHLGAARNFLELTKHAKSPYVIFCDQDDIWFEKKLERLINFAEKSFYDGLPCLVMCDGYGYSNSSGTITSDRVWLWYAHNLEQFLFFNAGYQGCNVLFNAKLNQYLQTYRADYYYMHDDVASLIAHTFGRVFFLHEKLMLYRQHDTNVTGNITTGLRQRIRLFFRKNAFVVSRNHYREKEEFLREYGDEMSSEARNLFTEYIRFPQEPLIKRLLLLIKNGFSLGGNYLPLYLKTILRRPIE